MLYKSFYKSGLFVILSLLFMQLSYAQDAPISDAEIALLPPYCQATVFKKGSPDFQKLWHQRIAGRCDGLHHYCFGLNWLNRARMAMGNKQQYKYSLERVVGEISYLLGHASPTCPLLKEAQNYKNMAETMLKRRF
jgi:hypothetical protein